MEFISMSKFTTDINAQTITVNGKTYAPGAVDELQALSPELAGFLHEWFDGQDTLTVHTSGSTGTPKELRVEKRRMMNSAGMTLSFLGLNKNDSALLCMPLRYIAGKMVVVRALVGDLDLIPIPPAGHPLRDLKEVPAFAAMIPMQVYNSLQDAEESRRLREIKHLIIGGGAIDENLSAALSDFPHDVWSTYGMTETLSHIALRKLNGREATEWYTPFGGVTLAESAEGTLIIDAPAVCADTLQTNDLVAFDAKGRFRILGRRDNTINTGGVKVQIEEVEALLKPHLPYPFLITSAPDEKFGERIVLLVAHPDDATLRPLLSEACRVLPPYWQPKQVVSVDEIPLTETGKPDRARAKRMVTD